MVSVCDIACQEEVHFGDVGTSIQALIIDCDPDTGVESALNVSTAITKEIKFKKPSGATVLKTATFVTDGTDGLIQYITEVDFLDEVGWWEYQGITSLPGGKWSSQIVPFEVKANL